MRGTCRLCLSEADLQDSHILPKWAYKKARGSGPNPHPVMIADGLAVQTSEQVTQHLLCTSCEQRFSVVERVVSQLVFQDAVTAPLLAKIGPEVAREGDWRAAEAGSLDVDQLVYFGASVVWRGSVSSEITDCSLGPRYEEEFRRYLLGGSFPENAACLIAFFDQPPNGGGNIARLCTLPNSQRDNGCHAHRFYVHGLFYYLLVGGMIWGFARRMCAQRSSPRMIMLTSQENLLDWFGATFAGARRIGALAQTLKRGKK